MERTFLEGEFCAFVTVLEKEERALCQELSLNVDLAFTASALDVALSCCGFCLQV